MKLNTAINVIERSGDLNDEENFTIALTAKAIEVLSSQIYKDAHLAIVRELGTNAADSHIDAGKRDVPFDVKLPNGMSPEFSIRDYGTGMAYEKVMTMYRTYFGSDRTHSNEFTGGLGLGSKSPLAYTDQFNVTSWYNGEKSVYTIYKNEKGLPAINRIYHDKSDEQTGLEVKLSIKKTDFSIFRYKAIDVYQWFTPRPNVIGVNDNEWPKKDISMEGEFWSLRKIMYNPMTVLMGNVAYHIDRNDLSPIYSKLDHASKVLADAGPIFRVNVGDVDIAASRETLKFDSPKTYATITKLLKQMGDEITKTYIDKLQNAPTHWEARKLFREFHNTLPLGSILPKTSQWKGIPVESKIPLEEFQFHKLTRIFASARKFFVKKSNRTGKMSVSSHAVHEISCESGAELIIADSKKYLSRICHYVREGPQNCIVYYISPATLPEGIDYEKKTKPEILTLDEFFKEQHIEDVILKTSNLPDPPKNVTGFRAKSYQTLKPCANIYTSSDWSEQKVDFDAGGVYVEVKGNYWSANDITDKNPRKEYKANDLINYFSLTEKNQIVGVRLRSVKDFESSSQWQRLDKYLIKKFKNYPEAKEAAIKSEVYKNLVISSSKILRELVAWKIKDADVFFGKVSQACKDLKSFENSSLAKKYMMALPFLGVDLNIDKQKHEYYDLFQAFYKRYPLLELVEINSYSAKMVQDYIDLVENSHKEKKPTIRMRKSLVGI